MAIVKRIREDGKPSYQVRVRDEAGKFHNKTFRNKQLAQQYEREWLSGRESGNLINSKAGSTRFGEYADTWLVDRPRPLSPKTIDLYRWLLDSFLLETFGNMPINRISAEAVRSWHKEVSERPENSRAKAYRLLRAILNTALAADLITKNPCKIKGAGEERSKERPLVTPETVIDLAEAVDPSMKALILLAGFGGLRRGELFGLRREDIDIEAGSVHVRRQVIATDDGKMIEREPKTAAGIRKVHLPPSIMAELAVHLDAFTGEPGDSPVFVGPEGAQLGTSTLYREYRRARAELGIEGVRLHDLRHAAAVLAAQTGATTKELMSRLGHSSSRAALRYQHAAESGDHRIGQALEAFTKRAES